MNNNNNNNNNNWKDRVKQDLDADVARQIICPVPVGEPVK